MSRDRARSRSADAAGGILGRPLAIAATSAWLVYWAVYAITFALTGQPVAVAIRGGFANAFPDGLLLLVALRVSRRLDRDGAAVSALVRGHAVVAAAAIPLAAAAKMTFIWVDMVVIHHFKFQFSWGTVTWQMLLSTMMYVAVSAMAHTWLIAQRLRDEEEHAVRADALRVRAEMAALRAQLNPHFLFNTLHSVLGLVRRDPALAESALEKLGDMLHYATRVHRDGVDWTSLRQELEFAETYLSLEKIRLGDRLQVDRQVEESVLDSRVPTFSVQPLVENAVRHGVAPRAAGGTIAIQARAEAGAVWLQVSNSADGPTPPPAPGSEEGGLGLRVLRDRLSALYGGAARMTAGPTAGGYSVVLTLPPGDASAEAKE